MPFLSAYCLIWVSLTLDVGYLFMAAPAKHSHCSLPWTRGISYSAGGCDMARHSAAERSHPTSEVRGDGWEEQPHIQGAVAARVPEVLEELFHVQGREGWR